MFVRGLCKNDFLKSCGGATVNEWSAYWKGLSKSERMVCHVHLSFSCILSSHVMLGMGETKHRTYGKHFSFYLLDMPVTVHYRMYKNRMEGKGKQEGNKGQGRRRRRRRNRMAATGGKWRRWEGGRGVEWKGGNGQNVAEMGREWWMCLICRG